MPYIKGCCLGPLAALYEELQVLDGGLQLSQPFQRCAVVSSLLHRQ